MQKSSVEPKIFPTFQHKVERVPYFARISEVRHMLSVYGVMLHLFQEILTKKPLAEVAEAEAG